MNEKTGVLIALLSSALGGGAAVATRSMIGSFDPLTLATVRFGGGALLLLPIALLLRPKWPSRADWPAVAGVGFLFYAVFFVFYNLALAYTTVGRGTLALSTLPLLTMVCGAALGREKLSARKTAGVLLAMGGVAVGGGALLLISLLTGRIALISSFSGGEALSGLYLAAGGGAFGFFLWVLALKYASPTKVANTITINPFIAMIAGTMLLAEPVTLPLILGLIAVCAGVWVATMEGRTGEPRTG